MAKYGKNNYFDGVILPEPKEEMLRRMAKGVKMGYNQYVDKSASTMFKSPSMPIGTNDFTLEYFGNLYGAVVQWLDSAPQLPEANGILPPLDASVGGYDLAAIGNPKIII